MNTLINQWIVSDSSSYTNGKEKTAEQFPTNRGSSRLNCLGIPTRNEK